MRTQSLLHLSQSFHAKQRPFEMDKTIITWNVTNWITVFLMVFLGFSIVSAVGAAIVKAKARADA